MASQDGYSSPGVSSPLGTHVTYRRQLCRSLKLVQVCGTVALGLELTLVWTQVKGQLTIGLSQGLPLQGIALNEECLLLGYKNPVFTSQETLYISATEHIQFMLCMI
jgi:hypothetical protein